MGHPVHHHNIDNSNWFEQKLTQPDIIWKNNGSCWKQKSTTFNKLVVVGSHENKQAELVALEALWLQLGTENSRPLPLGDFRQSGLAQFFVAGKEESEQ